MPNEFTLFIAADIEGTGGYVSWPPQPPEDPWHRGRMTAEINAAVKGARAGGADVVVVSDIHWGKENVIPDELNGSASLIRGTRRCLMWMGGVEKARLAFLIGFHARAGLANAVLPHTLDLRIIRLEINGREAGEIFLSSAYAGYYGVPVGLVTGDRAAAEEAGEILPNVETVVVKEGVGNQAARCLHPAESAERICRAAEKAVKRALKGEFLPYKLPDQVTLKIEFIWPAYADALTLVPGVSRTGGREITYVGGWLDVFKLISLFVNWVKPVPGLF